MSLAVQHGTCPFNNKNTYALYTREYPVVPATVFLRHIQANVQLESNTLAAYAYALKSFFDFLLQNSESFWEIKVSTIKQYKRFYLNAKDENGRFLLKRKSARQYLSAIKALVHYWRGLKDDDPLLFDSVADMDGVRRKGRGHGFLSHMSWQTRIPNELWKINIPITEKHYKPRYKGLSPEESKEIMQALGSAKRQTEVETMLYYRNRAIWAFLLMSGVRKGELVRVRTVDASQEKGTVCLEDRPEDAWLGQLKTGPGCIYVTPINPYWSFINSWLMEGRWIAERILLDRGEDDHGMLFCNRDGGPLTQPAVDYMFLNLKKNPLLKNVRFIHPHIARHTTATAMLNNGVALPDVQKFLRHRSILSTEIYARITDPTFRTKMEEFWSSLR